MSPILSLDTHQPCSMSYGGNVGSEGQLVEPTVESLLPDLQIIIPRLRPNLGSAVSTPKGQMNPTHTKFPSTNVLRYTVRP